MPFAKRAYSFKETLGTPGGEAKKHALTPLRSFRKIKSRGQTRNRDENTDNTQEAASSASPFVRGNSVRLKSFRKRKMAAPVDGSNGKREKLSDKNKDEIEVKIEENMKMKDGLMKLMTGCHDTTQAMEISKNLLTINSRMLSLMSSLQKKRSSIIMKDHNKQSASSSSKHNCEPCLADIAISDIRIPLMWKADAHFKTKAGEQSSLLYHMFCLLKINDQVYDTPLSKFSEVDTDVAFDEVFTFHGVPSDFKLEMEVYFSVMQNPDNPAWTPMRTPKKSAYSSVPKYCLAAHSQLTVDDIQEGFSISDFVMGGVGASATAVLGHADDFPDNPLALWGQFSSQLRARPTCMKNNCLEGHLLIQSTNGSQPVWDKYFCRLQQCSIQGWKYFPKKEESFCMMPALSIKLKKGMKVRMETSRDSNHNILILASKNSEEKEPVLSFDNDDDLHKWQMALQQAIVDAKAWKYACKQVMDIEEFQAKKTAFNKAMNFYDQISTANGSDRVSPVIARKNTKQSSKASLCSFEEVPRVRSFYEKINIMVNENVIEKKEKPISSDENIQNHGKHDMEIAEHDIEVGDEVKEDEISGNELSESKVCKNKDNDQNFPVVEFRKKEIEECIAVVVNATDDANLKLHFDETCNKKEIASDITTNEIKHVDNASQESEEETRHDMFLNKSVTDNDVIHEKFVEQGNNCEDKQLNHVSNLKIAEETSVSSENLKENDENLISSSVIAKADLGGRESEFEIDDIDSHNQSYEGCHRSDELENRIEETDGTNLEVIVSISKDDDFRKDDMEGVIEKEADVKVDIEEMDSTNSEVFVGVNKDDDFSKDEIEGVIEKEADVKVDMEEMDGTNLEVFVSISKDDDFRKDDMEGVIEKAADVKVDMEEMDGTNLEVFVGVNKDDNFRKNEMEGVIEKEADVKVDMEEMDGTNLEVFVGVSKDDDFRKDDDFGKVEIQGAIEKEADIKVDIEIEGREENVSNKNNVFADDVEVDASCIHDRLIDEELNLNDDFDIEKIVSTGTTADKNEKKDTDNVEVDMEIEGKEKNIVTRDNVSANDAVIDANESCLRTTDKESNLNIDSDTTADKNEKKSVSDDVLNSFISDNENLDETENSNIENSSLMTEGIDEENDSNLSNQIQEVSNHEDETRHDEDNLEKEIINVLEEMDNLLEHDISIQEEENSIDSEEDQVTTTLEDNTSLDNSERLTEEKDARLENKDDSCTTEVLRKDSKSKIMTDV